MPCSYHVRLQFYEQASDPVSYYGLVLILLFNFLVIVVVLSVDVVHVHYTIFCGMGCSVFVLIVESVWFQCFTTTTQTHACTEFQSVSIKLISFVINRRNTSSPYDITFNP